MTHRFLAKMVACAVVGSICLSLSAAANLIPDPNFKKFDYDSEKHAKTWKERWLPFQIEGPSSWEKDGKKVEVKGGKTFLHCPRYDVEEGQKLNISLSAQGSGKVSVQGLYRTEDGRMTDPHRTIPIEPVEIEKDKAKEIKGTDTVPADAAEAYIRIVVEGGTATISDPVVTVAD